MKQKSVVITKTAENLPGVTGSIDEMGRFSKMFYAGEQYTILDSFETEDGEPITQEDEFIPASIAKIFLDNGYAQTPKEAKKVVEVTKKLADEKPVVEEKMLTGYENKALKEKQEEEAKIKEAKKKK